MGKSTLTKKLLSETIGRKVIFDYADEYNMVFVRSAEAFVKFDRKFPDKSVAVKFDIDMESDEIIGMTEDILHYLYKKNLNTENKTTVVFEEAQFFFPNHLLPQILQRILTVGRHANISIIANSQRPVLVSKTLLSMADETYIGNIVGINDLSIIEKTHGKKGLEASSLNVGEFLVFDGPIFIDKITNDFKDL